MSEIPIFTVDAFTNSPFTGNPAAVCLLEEELDDDLQQKIAREMNISETAFVTKSSGEDFSTASTFGLRWFTPTTEVPLCGHATLAAATVIFREKANPGPTIAFTTRYSGTLTATLEDARIVLELPLNPPEECAVAKYSRLVDIAAAGLPVQQCSYSASTKKLLVRLEDGVTREELESMTPAVGQLTTIQQTDVKGIIVTARGGSGDPYDFVSRYLAPWVGIPEDPVTGSAHTVLAPFWSKHLQRSEFTARQCSARGGDLKLKIKGNWLQVSGESVIVLKGMMKIH